MAKNTADDASVTPAQVELPEASDGLLSHGMDRQCYQVECYRTRSRLMSAEALLPCSNSDMINPVPRLWLIPHGP